MESKRIKVVIKKLDGKRMDVDSDEWGTMVCIMEHGQEVSTDIYLSPSNVKYLHEYLGESLERWESTEI